MMLNTPNGFEWTYSQLEESRLKWLEGDREQVRSLLWLYGGTGEHFLRTRWVFVMSEITTSAKEGSSLAFLSAYWIVESCQNIYYKIESDSSLNNIYNT